MKAAVSPNPMRESVNYCSFYETSNKSFLGQKNLSDPVKSVLRTHFDVNDISVVKREAKRFPKLFRVILALHAILGMRMLGRRAEVTVVDLVHSFATLERAHFQDKFILIGHDSYALRCRRDLKYARTVAEIFRRGISYVAWLYVEALVRHITWRSFYVSPIDRDFAARTRPSGVLAIPVREALRQHRANRPRRTDAKAHTRILIPVPVSNRPQNRADREVIQAVHTVFKGIAHIKLWGVAARQLRTALSVNEGLGVVDWTEDYAGFLQGFDLLVYPRVIGSGFHTKLAEALVLGLPCVCAHWVARPLLEVGYDGVYSFSRLRDLPRLLERLRDDLVDGTPLTIPSVPAKAQPEAALAPLVEACVAGNVRGISER